MKVTPINKAELGQFWDDFQALTQESQTLCVVSVRKDGRPDFLLPIPDEGILALVGALNAASDELLARLYLEE